jgi:hypothetical protein
VLPRRDGKGFAKVEIVPMTAAHAEWWHTNVQTTIKATYRSSNDMSTANQQKKVRADYDWS